LHRFVGGLFSVLHIIFKTLMEERTLVFAMLRHNGMIHALNLLNLSMRQGPIQNLSRKSLCDAEP